MPKPSCGSPAHLRRQRSRQSGRDRQTTTSRGLAIAPVRRRASPCCACAWNRGSITRVHTVHVAPAPAMLVAARCVGSSRSNDGTDDHDEKLRQRRLAPPSQATQALAASAAQITAATVVLHHAGCSGCRGTIGCAFSSQNTRRKSRVELSSSLSRPYSAEAILAPSLPLPVNTRSSCEPVYSPEKANSAG